MWLPEPWEWLESPCEWELPLSLLSDFLLPESEEDELDDSDFESEESLFDDLPFDDLRPDPDP